MSGRMWDNGSVGALRHIQQLARRSPQASSARCTWGLASARRAYQARRRETSLSAIAHAHTAARLFARRMESMKKYCFLLLSVCLISGCDDGNSEGESQDKPACTGTQTRCTPGGQIETCVNGQWGAAQDCPQNQTCSGNSCSGSGEGGENEKPACTGTQTRCTPGGQIETCADGQWGAAQDCPQDKTCNGTACIPISSTCEAGAAQCVDKQIQYCENGSWGLAKNCPVNQECRGNSCTQVVTENDKHTLNCGSSVCNEGQMCKNGATCTDRLAKASQADSTCDPETFLDSCDGNTLVYCKKDTSSEHDHRVIALPCGEGFQCALKFEQNFGFCAKSDVNCNEKTAGDFPICHETTNLHYLEIMKCALAADGYYYPFRDENETIDCIGTCTDAYSCDTQNTDRPCATEGVHCEGDISVICGPDDTGSLQSSTINCADYTLSCPGITCLTSTGDCDWDKCGL